MDWIEASKRWKFNPTFTKMQHDLQDRLKGVPRHQIEEAARRIVAEWLARYLDTTADDLDQDPDLHVTVQFCPASMGGGSNVTVQFGASPGLITPVPCIDEL